MKKLIERMLTQKIDDVADEPGRHCIELRIDEKGLIYTKGPLQSHVPIKTEDYAHICQMLGTIALMEMQDKTRVLH